MPVDDGRDIRGTLYLAPKVSISEEDSRRLVDTVVKKFEEEQPTAEEKKKENSFGSFFYDEDGNEFYLKEVIYNAPVVACNWSDGTKTTSKCDMLDTYSVDTGLAICVLKKLMGGKFFARLLENWTPDVYTGKLTKITLKDVLKRQS